MDKSGSVVLLNGMGGMGKSELLNCWVHKVADNNPKYEHILYLDCSNGIANAFESMTIKSELGIADDDPNKMQSALNAIATYHDSHNLLLVLDDLPWQKGKFAENINLVNELKQKFRYVIATSRKKYDEKLTPIEVSYLDDKNIIVLFVKNHLQDKDFSNKTTDEILASIPKQNYDDIVNITNRAGKHTLTIEILAKTAYENDWTTEKLLKLLSEQDFDYSDLTTDVVYDMNNTYHEETLSKALIQLFNLAGLDVKKKHILYHLSCTNSQDFTKEAVSAWLDDDVASILTKLYRMGWIQQIRSTASKELLTYSDGKDPIVFYRLHQSVSYAVYNDFTDKMLMEQRYNFMFPVAERMETIYQASDHNNREETCIYAIGYYLKKLVDNCYEQQDDFIVDSIDKLNQFTIFCQEQGMYDLGKNLLEAKIHDIETLVEKKHFVIAISLNSLAGLYEDLGEYEKVLPLYKKAMAIQRKLLGEDHIEYARTLHNLAGFYEEIGEYQKALILYEKSIKITSPQIDDIYSNEASDLYGISLNDLAFLHESMGNYEEALILFKKSKFVIKKRVGENHPDYALSLNNLAHLYKTQGNYDKALSLFSQATEIMKLNFGEEHDDYATCLNNLSVLYGEIGNYELAINFCKQAMEIYKNIFGLEHTSHFTSLNNLGAIYEEMGDYDKALSLFEKAIEVIKTVLGENHVYYTTSLNNVASIYESIGKYEKSLQLFKQTISITKKILGDNHPDYATSLNNLAILYNNMGNYEKAIPLFEKAIDIRKAIFGENHTNTQTLVENYLDCKAEMDN